MIALFLLFLAIPVIAIIDYFAFNKIWRCTNCGNKPVISDFIIPTFMEVSLFIIGFWLGSQNA